MSKSRGWVAVLARRLNGLFRAKQSIDMFDSYLSKGLDPGACLHDVITRFAGRLINRFRDLKRKRASPVVWV
jgi:hypothetical protein